MSELFRLFRISHINDRYDINGGVLCGLPQLGTSSFSTISYIMCKDSYTWCLKCRQKYILRSAEL